MIIGIDEVGRGAWAGPLAVGAVALDGAEFDGLTDSKLLTPQRRLELEPAIKQRSRQAALGWVSSVDIDRIGLSAALTLAIERALEQLVVADVDQIIIDGTVNFLKDSRWADRTTTLKQADLVIPSVSAASVLAKVARDRYMTSCHRLWPDYGFAAHVGYGTAGHRQAIDRFGLTPLHRRSFGRLKTVRQLSPIGSGQLAEAAAARHLEGLGYRIVDRNWSTRWCEIDIIARSGQRLLFVEVRHRSSADFGAGLGSITPSKLRQMRRAAEIWLACHQTTDLEYELAVVATAGRPVVIEQFIDQL